VFMKKVFLLLLVLSLTCGLVAAQEMSYPTVTRSVTSYDSYLFSGNQSSQISSLSLQWEKTEYATYTLEITMTLRNGGSGVLTLWGGMGLPGQAMFWFPQSDWCDYEIEGDFLWPTYRNGRSYDLPEIVWINGDGSGNTNTLVFMELDRQGNPSDVFATIQCNNTLFPSSAASASAPATSSPATSSPRASTPAQTVPTTPAPTTPAPAPTTPAATAYPAVLTGNLYSYDTGDGSPLTADFFEIDACDVYGLTCPYDYDPSSGRGIIYDPTAPATAWFSFVVNRSGSVLTFYQTPNFSGTAVPMRKQ
jgi:hypothetical protein